MSLLALKEWLGHRCLASTQRYATVSPGKLTQAYVDARYFERNIAVVQVLLDRAAIESGAAGKGSFTLGMATVRIPTGHNASTAWPASGATSMCPEVRRAHRRSKANTHNQRLLEQIPVTETERKALSGDQAALRQLIESSPTSSGP